MNGLRLFHVFCRVYVGLKNSFCIALIFDTDNAICVSRRIWLSCAKLFFLFSLLVCLLLKRECSAVTCGVSFERYSAMLILKGWLPTRCECVVM